MKAFQKPLSISQEKYYLQKYQEGDSQAKNILIEHNLRLVAHVVKKYQGTGEDTDDLISIGTIGLIKAVTTFNPQKASRLSTYAARCIENELLMYFRAKKKHSKEVSLYEPIGTDKEGNEINLLDVIESAPVDIVEDCYIRENTDYLLRSLKKVLSDKEYQVICCRYGALWHGGRNSAGNCPKTVYQPLLCLQDRKNCSAKASRPFPANAVNAANKFNVGCVY